jgi:hypothetical protein
MSGQHDLPEDFILKWMQKYEDKVLLLEELSANEVVAERKRNVSVFSDAQSERMEAMFVRTLSSFLNSDAFASRVHKIAQDIAGAQALRFVVWLLGSFILGAISVIFAYFKLKGG